MAFKMSDVNSWGTGALGDVSNPSGQVNSYANVTAISGATVTIGTPSAGAYETFTVGAEIVLHVSAITTGTDLQYLGKYIFAKITAVNGSILTLDKDVSGLVASGVFANHHVQILTVAQFDTLNLTATIAPPAYSVTNKYGGILAFKCKTLFNYAGSAAINLVAKGIPIANIAYRPATIQEGTAAQIGWENHITSRNMYMNCPDGIAFIAAKASTGSGTTARFGGTTPGVARYPYNNNSTSNTTAVGGPTIMWLSETITGFDVSVISKTSSNASGKGVARCYIATESKLPSDEGLYALDCLSNTARLSSMGIKDFGTGALGTVLSLSGQINSYAPIVSVSTDGRTINIGTVSQGVYETFTSGTRIIFHVSQQTGTDNIYLGKFIQSTILSVSGSSIVVDTPITNVVPSNITSNYKCQVITVCQFDTLALSTLYSSAKAFDDVAGCGGILAISGKTSIDLQNGNLYMCGKGIQKSSTRPCVSWQCSGVQKDCLPISQGHGSVIILTKKLTLNSSTLIGGNSNGAAYGGAGGSDGGYPGSFMFGGLNSSANRSGGGVGSLGAGGTYVNDGEGYPGGAGYGGGGSGTISAGASNPGVGGVGGSSIFIVADDITNFSITPISTGGTGGSEGYGSAPGGAGGGPGTCFIYCNTVTNPDYTAFQAS